MYEVFIRNWWRIENGKKVPDPGAEKEFLGEVFETQDEARAFCREYNSENDPGILSRKAEFQEY